MDDALVLIPAVTKSMTHWTVKVTITEEMPTLIGYQRGTHYKRYMLTDVEGNTIPVVVYGSDIATFANTLLLHGVYAITNAVIKPPSGAKVSAFNTLHWVLQRDTLIRPLLGELPNLRYFLDTIIPLCDVGYAADVDDVTVDIMAIVIKADDIKPVTTRFGEGTVQHFVIVDAGRTPVSLSIWDQQIEHHGPNLTAAAATYSVVVAKRLKIKNYRGIALTANNGSSFTIDPPIEAAASLKTWFDAVREIELPNMLEGYSVAFAKNLVDRNIVRKFSVGEVRSNGHCGDFWVRALLQLSAGEQRLYYIGCSNCYTKVSTHAGVEYRCLVCNKNVVASIRPRVSMDVYDHSGRMTVGAIESVAEQILQCTPTELSRLVREGIGFELEPLKSEFEDKMYLVLLRRTYSSRAEAQQRLILVAYFDDTVPPKITPTRLIASLGESSSKADVDSADSGNVAHTSIIDSPTPNPSTKTVESELEVSPLKRQLVNVSILDGSPAKKTLFPETNVSSPELANHADKQDSQQDLPST